MMPTRGALILVAISLVPSLSAARGELVPAVELTPAIRETLIRREGFVQGVAIGLISTGAVTAGLSAFPFLSVADHVETGEFSLFRGGIQLGVGGILALAGLAGIAGGAYLSSEYSRSIPGDPRQLALWRAARLKGLALILALQGLVNTAIALPFLILSDDHLETVTGNVPLSRTVGHIDIAVGGAHLAAAIALGLIGHFWDPRSLGQIVLAPSVNHDTAMLSLHVAF